MRVELLENELSFLLGGGMELCEVIKQQKASRLLHAHVHTCPSVSCIGDRHFRRTGVHGQEAWWGTRKMRRIVRLVRLQLNPFYRQIIGRTHDDLAMLLSKIGKEQCMFNITCSEYETLTILCCNKFLLIDVDLFLLEKIYSSIVAASTVQ